MRSCTIFVRVHGIFLTIFSDTVRQTSSWTVLQPRTATHLVTVQGSQIVCLQPLIRTMRHLQGSHSQRSGSRIVRLIIFVSSTCLNSQVGTCRETISFTGRQTVSHTSRSNVSVTGLQTIRTHSRSRCSDTWRQTV